MINCDRDIVEKPAVGTDWRSDEVMFALGAVFKNKCYICERYDSTVHNFSVDHFIPQNVDEDLKYEWSNLYLCCMNCNGGREKKFPLDGLLDPCNPSDDVESEIIYKIEPFFHEPKFLPAKSSPTKKVENTINMLTKAHYGSAQTSIKCAAVRNLISRCATEMFFYLNELNKAKQNGDKNAENDARFSLERMISYEAPFTMLMRYIYDNHA